MKPKIIRTVNSVSDALRVKTEEILITKHKKGQDLADIDIVGILEWIEGKDGVSLIQLLRSFALLCETVEGLEEVFFTMARELPEKLELESLTTEAINDCFENHNTDSFTPIEYIKTLKKIFSNTVNSQDFIKKFDDNFLNDSFKEINSRFKIITIEDYNNLLKKQNNTNNENTDNSSNSLNDYANNLTFDRTILRSTHETNN